MAKKVDYSVEDKLRALYDLQLVDSRIDKLRSVRGELPLEVQDLEDEVSGLEVRLEKINTELDLYGFDWYEDTDNLHYYEKVDYTEKVHSFQEEKEYIQLLSQTKIGIEIK